VLAERTTVFKQRAPSRDPQGPASPLALGGGGLWPPENREETLKFRKKKSKATGLRNELDRSKRNAC